MIRAIFSNLGYHDEGRFRNLSVNASSLYSCKISATLIAKGLGRLSVRHPAEVMDILRTIKALCMFMSDNFNNHVGKFSAEDIDKKDPSTIVMEALCSNDPDCRGTIEYPKTLRTAERLGIISQKNFFAFANLYASVAQKEQRWALELRSERDPIERARIREEMVKANIKNYTIPACMIAHIFKPHDAIIEAESIDMGMLERIYPEIMGGPFNGTHLTYSNIACVNRILREMYDDRLEPDPVIGILERDGKYTPELQQQVEAVAKRYLQQKTIPISELPRDLQLAIQENQARILASISELKGVERVLAWSLAKVNLLGGAPNRVARVKAYDAGCKMRGQVIRHQRPW